MRIEYLNFLHLVPVKEPPNPFWSHLKNQSKKQKALTLAILVLICMICIAGIGLCIFMRCRQRKSRWKAGKPRTSGTGGNYQVLFNLEDNEHYGNGDNSLF
ncbi:unnamed protein product [Rodentolepis nana]|uniref:Uncharacterized protein n=1 Tax=Rodentolepis nana TaxID=102285 RepID=A0A0R3T377_RODNA|nr:unnamed protein product [Rodentolepis nana]